MMPVFYPADVQMGRSGWLGKHKGPAKGLDWFIHPIAESVRGYEHFSGTRRMLAASACTILNAHRQQIKLAARRCRWHVARHSRPLIDHLVRFDY
jgi:hypothetical protein